MIKQAILAVALLIAPVSMISAAETAPQPVTAVPSAAEAVNAAGLININTADEATLARELSGIGAVKARAIVEYREAQGPFDRIEDLLEVQGIGSGLVERNRERMIAN